MKKHILNKDDMTRMSDATPFGTTIHYQYCTGYTFNPSHKPVVSINL